MPIEDLRCPDCKSKMKPRKNGSTGQMFWGCVNYPKCKGTRDTDGMSKDEREGPTNKFLDDGLPSERAANNDKRRW